MKSNAEVADALPDLIGENNLLAIEECFNRDLEVRPLNMRQVNKIIRHHNADARVVLAGLGFLRPSGQKKFYDTTETGSIGRLSERWLPSGHIAVFAAFAYFRLLTSK